MPCNGALSHSGASVVFQCLETRSDENLSHRLASVRLQVGVAGQKPSEDFGTLRLLYSHLQFDTYYIVYN